jgi:hypothetical protein
MSSNDPGGLDRFIQQTLSEYSSVEPLAGLEQRILNRIHVSQAPHQPRSWRWAFALIVLAGFLGSLPDRYPLTRSRHSNMPGRPQSSPSVRSVDGGRQSTQPPSAPGHLYATHSSKSRPARPLPKRRNFHVPTPLTPNERALLTLSEQHPAETQQAFADLQNRTNQPIEIPAIEVRPLLEISFTPKEN